jgi:hypothetical protein
MITTRLMGGMGNQMFQYAFGLAQARRFNTTVALDPTLLTRPNRGFVLGQWSMDLSINKAEPTLVETNMRYDPYLEFSVKNNDVLQGYWQSEHYFSNVYDELRQRAFVPFKPFSHALEQEISEVNSVAVHVRRGDYLIEPHKSFHGNLEWASYYKPAMDKLRALTTRPMFYIFTDDPEWVRTNWYTDFSLGEQTIVPQGRESEDIFLMSRCKHAVIANSSFSWWGAWLGDTEYRVVIAPRQWFQDSNTDYSTIVPERWFRI